ncbi:MAE_28990/MAE_18760 family HEPN-like nuclease [Aliarcobacter butzleri]
MKIKTITHLDDFLDQNIAWRKKELTLAINDYTSANNHKKNYYLRVLIVTIYCHWEGFIKQSSEGYLEYISSLRLNLDTLNKNFISLCLDNYIDNFSSINNISSRNNIVSFLLNELSQNKYQFKKGQINTQSNLNMEVLEKICLSIGIDQSQLNIDIVWVDKRLLKYRNAISHGEKLTKEEITFELIELKDKIQNALDIYKNLISNAAYTKSYLKI